MTANATPTWRFREVLPGASRFAVAFAAVFCLLLIVGPSGALADQPGPGWTISVVPGPTVFTPGDSSGSDGYVLTITNVGSAPTSGTYTVTDTLPPGLTVDASGPSNLFGGLSCTSTAQTVTCTGSGSIEPDSLDYNNFNYDQVVIPVDVAASVGSSVVDTATISGGGAPAASTSETTTAGSTPAGFGFVGGNEGLQVTVEDVDGNPATQAASHPGLLSVTTNFNTSERGGGAYPSDHAKDVSVALPQGMILNPNATVAKCTEAELESDGNGGGCPADSMVGYVSLNTQIDGLPQPLREPLMDTQLFNMVPQPGASAELAFDAGKGGVYQHIIGTATPDGGYALTSGANDLNTLYQLAGITTVIFGTSQGSSAPLLTMPSACSSSMTATATVDAWENPGVDVTDTAPVVDQNGDPVPVTNCGQEDFTPQMSVAPDTNVADSPSGLSVDLSLPQNASSVVAEADLEDASVSLPAGMSINPSSANGLGACTPAEIGLDNASEPSCPDNSKIGTVTVDTPLLSDPLTGSIYVAQPHNNPFDSLLAIYVAAEADGSMIKLAGQVSADPVTGQLTTTFNNNPQLPFSDFKLDFWGGPGAVLTSPPACGTYTSQSSLSPWSGTAAVSLSDPFAISSGCVTGFDPSFTAWSENTQAGAYAPFVVSFSRQDSDQFFSGLSATLPDGVLARLAGVGECSDAQLAQAAANTGAQEQANPSCPSDSQVGTVMTGAGSGPDPYYLPGKVYLTGPYKDAPFGLAAVVPAVAGPYDLGTVVIRQQLQINPSTAQVTVVSDPFPTVLQGIPLHIRSVTVTMDRPDFTLNPTSCGPAQVTGVLSSTAGSSADVRSHFEVGGCRALRFSPKLRIGLSGRGQTRSGDHPTLTARLSQPAGQGNLHNVQVKLPLSLALDVRNSEHVCPYAVAQAVMSGPADCPSSTLVGRASAVTPLLSQPLSGPVYLVQGLSFANGVETHTLPTLLVALRGQIALNLRSQTSVSRGKLVSTFASIPDAAVSRFTLTINGGRKGILVITGRGRSICGKPQVTDATLVAQSGKTEHPDIRMTTPCRTRR